MERLELQRQDYNKTITDLRYRLNAIEVGWHAHPGWPRMTIMRLRLKFLERTEKQIEEMLLFKRK